MNSWSWILLLIFFGFMGTCFFGRRHGKQSSLKRMRQPDEGSSEDRKNEIDQHGSGRQQAHHGCC